MCLFDYSINSSDLNIVQKTFEIIVSENRIKILTTGTDFMGNLECNHKSSFYHKMRRKVSKVIPLRLYSKFTLQDFGSCIKIKTPSKVMFI